MPLDKLSDLAQQYLQEFQQLHGRSVIKQPPKQIIWKPPDLSTLKTNFDGAVFEIWMQQVSDSLFEIPLVKFWRHYLRSSLCHRLLLVWKQLQREEQSPFFKSSAWVVLSLKEILKLRSWQSKISVSTTH